MDQSLSTPAAAALFVLLTAAVLLFTLVWAVSTSRPVRRSPHLTGRPAVPYWHSPTGLQDERGIPPQP